MDEQRLNPASVNDDGTEFEDPSIRALLDGMDRKLGSILSWIAFMGSTLVVLWALAIYSWITGSLHIGR